jgi:aspartyl aminopeptidase
MPLDQVLPDEARDLAAFIAAAPTSYHAVQTVAARLEARGFTRCDERLAFALSPGGRGYVVRAGSIIAFVVGTDSPERAGFRLLGAHTDSPNLRLKPRSEFESSGFRQLAVEVYGGVLLSTWLDRDLGLAGRVVLSDGSEPLVNLSRPLFRIPNLAIHLNREVNKEGPNLNPQQHLNPIVSLEGSNDTPLTERLARALDSGPSSGVRAKDIIGFDLALYDVQAPTVGGQNDEFLFSARLDNLASCHAALSALLDGAESPSTRVIALYDHEEVGSQSAVGARSRFLESVLDRLATGYPGAGSEAFARALAGSLLVSADMAHAVHPNYSDKHDKLHRPVLGGGPVLKTNNNQAYATDGAGAAEFVRACRSLEIEPQYFVARNDMPCGSTIGPISAARLGIPTVDVGNPMLSMHSCREMAGVADIRPMIRVLTALLDGPRR